ncbi:hypothetical protein [Treponema saccharophilum]|uniref:Erythrocyte binding protein n=1 Tax=Treponema saccharophilum DSM 2985 TaxID=907348 RepID=H7EPF4_9SPIR|nr:hypothetical protein [Treponema saccharophilum]EIC00787.1 erythrocyte binding protein [Treponema saccharophilum DSM 2985]BDC95877.1 hypothetical protein TRSA_09760 [Treponema saccharophilum]
MECIIKHKQFEIIRKAPGECSWIEGKKKIEPENSDVDDIKSGEIRRKVYEIDSPQKDEACTFV